jgi:hypothetical protein
VRWYLRYGRSYRDVEELLAERGIEVDHVTVKLNAWLRPMRGLKRLRSAVGVGLAAAGWLLPAGLSPPSATPPPSDDPTTG